MPNHPLPESVERMIRVSKDHPLLPETFVPWSDEPAEETLYMPETMVSLQGHALWSSLDARQRIELGKLEVVQVMYSYAWSETLACYFFNRHLLRLQPESVEYRFLIRMLIEEFRHQEMFGMAIQKLQRQPIPPTRMHKLLAHITVNWLPPSLVYMSVLSVEMMADIFARHLRRDPRVFSVLRKSSELHHIEEGRHIFYTKHWLETFTRKAGPLRRTLYSSIILLNIIFLRSLYVRKAFFMELGLQAPARYYRAARRHYRHKFAGFALEGVTEFVASIRGFNAFTKPLWRWFLNVHL